MAHIRDRWFVEGGDGKKARTARHGQGRRWQLEYFDNAGKRHSPTFTTRTAADTKRKEVEASLLTSTFVDPAKSKTLFRAYVEGVWMPAQLQHAPATAALAEQTLRLHITPKFGDAQLGRIPRSAVQAWVTSIAETHAPSTVGRIFGLFASVMGAAVADEYIPRSPCKGVNLPPVTHAPVVPLPVLAVEALVDAAPDYWRPAVILAAGSGLREGEVLGLTVDRAEFLHRRVRVDRQVQSPAGKGKPALRPTKTPSSDRLVPLGEVVCNALAAHVEQHPPALVEVDETTERAKGAKSKRVQVRLLWAAPRGGAVRASSFRRMWAATVKRAEKALRAQAEDARRDRDLELASRCEAAADHLAAGVDFHDLRHFFASLLISKGANVKVIQSRLGHTSATVTLDVYGHLWPNSEEDTRTAVDAVLGGLAVGPTVHTPSNTRRRDTANAAPQGVSSS